MQCENIVDGKPCKANLSTEKFCPECGCDMKLDSVKTQPFDKKLQTSFEVLLCIPAIL
jgi:hypothetical protein